MSELTHPSSSQITQNAVFLRDFTSQPSKDYYELNSSHYEVVASCYKNHDLEKSNQDAGLIVPLSKKECILVVADGMGGHRCGDKASHLACRGILQELDRGLSVNEAIIHAIEQIHWDIKDLSVGAGSTIAVSHIHDHYLKTYHVGDSSIILFNRLGRVRYETICHSPVGFGVASGEINDSEAREHPEKHIVSNVLGLGEVYLTMSLPIEMGDHDTLVMMSDGHTEHHKTGEIFEFIKGNKLPDAMKTLVEATSEKIESPESQTYGHNDDSTAIIFRLVKSN